MKEIPAKSDPVETKRFGCRQQCKPVMAIQRDIDRDLLVHGMLSATHFGIPAATAVARIDDQRTIDRPPQFFQRIEKRRIVPVRTIAELASAFAGKFSRRKMRPAPASRIKQGDRAYQHAPKADMLTTLSDSDRHAKENAPEVTETSGAF
ncbi:hypothetical protein L53_02690 [Hyphomonas sp. L-53-1-40]|nr:hypothetical protein L53_02690 [Hyphomonas sp. L-53-1-40]